MKNALFVGLTLLVLSACRPDNRRTTIDDDVVADVADTPSVDAGGDAPIEDTSVDPDAGDTAPDTPDAAPDVAPDTTPDAEPDADADAEPDADTDVAPDGDTDGSVGPSLADRPFGYPFVPYDLFIHVTDDDGASLGGAEVSLDGIGGVADEDGDVVFRNLQPGAYRLSAVASGHTDGIWEVEIPHLHPEEVEIPHLHERRWYAELSPIGTRRSLLGAVGGVVSHELVDVIIAPGSLLDIVGNLLDVLGNVSSTVTALSPDRGFSSDSKATRADGTPATLDPIYAFDVSLRDDDAQPLQPDDRGITARLPAPAEAAPGTEYPTWVYDSFEARWREEPDGGAEVDDSGFIDVEIPHLSRWAVGEPAPADAACVRVSIPNAALYADAALKVRGLGVNLQTPVLGDVMDVVDVPARGDVELTLVVGGAIVTSDTVPVVAQSDGDPTTCAEDTTPLVLAAPDAVDAGDGPGRLRAYVVTESCPAVALAYTLTGPGGAFSGTTLGGTVVFDGLAAGDWRLSVSETVSGPSVGDLAVTVVDCGAAPCQTDARLVVPENLAARVPGGCNLPACIGDECDACVSVFVSGVDGVGVGDVAVSMYDPVEEALLTDGAGDLCVDVPGGAGGALMVFPEGSTAAVSRLTPSTSCADGTCARLPFSVGGPRLTCTLDRVAITSEATRFGFDDPTYKDTFDYRSPAPGTASYLTVEATGTGALSDALAASPVTRSATFGFRARVQNAVGAETSGSLYTQTRLTDTLGVEIKLTESALDEPLDIRLGRREMHVTLHDLESELVVGTWTSTSGSARAEGAEEGVRITFDGTFSDGDTTVTLVGTVQAPLATEATSATTLTNTSTYPLNGGVATVYYASHPEGLADAVYGQWPEAGARADVCVPETGAFLIAGAPLPGRYPTYTPLLDASALPVRIFGNSEPAAFAYAHDDVSWVDERYVASVYSGLGVSIEQATEASTIIGVGGTGGVETAAYSAAVLDHPTLGRITAVRVGDDFTPDPDGARFVFAAVPPVAFDDPYTLRLLDAVGAEIAEYEQRIVALPGAVGLVGPRTAF